MKHNLSTTLFYYNEDGDASPYAHTGKPCSAIISNVTGDKGKYSLDEHGFQLVNQTTKVKDFLTPATVETDYYPELEKLLKEVYLRAILSACCIPRPRNLVSDSESKPA